MLSGQSSYVRSPSNGRTHTLMFVCRHGYTICRPTNQDSEVPIGVHRNRQGVCVIRVIHACTIGSSMVHHFMSIFVQPREKVQS